MLPPLNIPESHNAVNVHIIDSTARLRDLPTKDFFEPSFVGFDTLDIPSYSFLVEHPPSNRRVLFDLGLRKDWHNLAPEVVGYIKDEGWSITVEKDVAQILSEGGVSLDSIEAIIWSHFHFDHIGDVSKFPESTSVVVGPGTQEFLLPGYPAQQDALILESDLEGRPVREIIFDDILLEIGGFKALDFFGDGSFYLLDSPGHTVGHMSALCRTTTSPDTFIFLGGDCADHGSEWRPTKYLPLPKEIKPSPLPRLYPGACPGSVFASIHRFHQKDVSFYGDVDAITRPFCTPTEDACDDVTKARETINHMSDFEAHENVYIIVAHDNTMLDIVDFFPNGSANDWKEKGWREKGMWRFLADFEGAVEKKIGSSAGMN